MWPLAVLTSDRITVFFFLFKEMYGRFSGTNKINNEVTVLPRWSWGGLCKERLRQRIVLKSFICGVFVAIAIVITSSKLPIKTRRRQRQRQRHKSLIWLVEWGKIIVLHLRQPLYYSFWCCLPMKTWMERMEDLLLCDHVNRRRTSTLEISCYH